MGLALLLDWFGEVGPKIILNGFLSVKEPQAVTRQTQAKCLPSKALVPLGLGNLPLQLPLKGHTS